VPPPPPPFGLLRCISAGNMAVCGGCLHPGTILSMPTFSLHGMPCMGVDMYKPDLWLNMEVDPDTTAPMQEAFNLFSSGLCTCVRRNLAMHELIIVAPVFHWY